MLSRGVLMQAVILAAGQSTRMFPLTITRPKPLLLLANRTLLEHKLDALQNIAEEAIIVVGYKKEMILNAIGKNYHGIKITYVEQKEQRGTGDALLLVKSHVKGKFIMMYGDDWYSSQDIKACIKHAHAVVVAEVDHPEHFGVIHHENMTLKGIIEKPSNPPSNLVNTGLYALDEHIFPHLENVGISERGDREFPPALVSLAQEKPVHCVKASQYYSIGYPWDLLHADLAIRKGEHAVRRTSTVTGKVENSSVGENCTIKGIVKNSIVMDHCIVEAHSLVEHSVFGYDVHFQGTIEASKAISRVNGMELDAGIFGSALGDNVRAKNATIMPGCKVWPHKKIEGTVREDVR
jgi:bifunctional UDP-N-acetylglucosamine pyrophosphorylase/glucosamine-1-phosphate N-acetyltransferase